MSFDNIYKNFLRFLIVIIYFVSPLIFFTNLTRNPYFFQITIINISFSLWLLITSIVFIKREIINIKISPLHVVFCLMILVFFITSLYGYFFHFDFFKPSILNENKKVWFFTIFNATLPLFLVSQLNREKDIEFPYSFSFVLSWGFAWFLFKILKSNHPFFDLYGIILWSWAIIYIYKKTRDDQSSILNLSILAGFYASSYGILQYLGLEIIWDKTLMPYGRRAVTTFGNPNFASSYMLMLIPFIIFLYSKAKGISKKFYFLSFIILNAMIFSSLTRSSIIGLFFSIVSVFYLNKKYRLIQDNDFKKIIFSFLILIIIWPDQNLSFGGGIVKRFIEVFKKTQNHLTILVNKENIYQSSHQRLLIWKSGIDMFLENPISGKGWGNFELFYPFYQGNYIRINPALKELRTHANNAHNELIEIISQTGVLGLGFAVLFIVSLIIHSIKNYKITNDFFIIISLISILSMIIDNMLNVSIHFAVPGLLFFTIIGFLITNFSKESTITTKKIKLFAILLIIISLLYSYQWVIYMGREIYYFLGFKEMRKFNFQSAKKYLEKAYNFHRWEVNNTYELANCYVKNGELEKAIIVYYDALKANAGYDEIYFNLSIVERNLLRFDTLKKNLRTSIWINPTNEKAYYAYAEVILREPNKIQTEDIFIIEDGLRNHPNDHYMHWIAGYLYEKLNDFKKAKQYYETSLTLDPTNSLYLNQLLKLTNQSYAIDFYNLYKIIISSDKYDKIEVSSRIKRIEEYLTENTHFLFMKAKYLYDIKEYDKSIYILLKIIEKEPSFLKALKLLGEIYEKKNELQLAINYYNKYLSYDNKNQEIYYKIEELKRMK